MRSILLVTIILLVSAGCDTGDDHDGDDDDGTGDVDTAAECDETIYDCEADWWSCHDEGGDTQSCSMAACECVPSTCWDLPGESTGSDSWAETFSCNG